MNELRIQGSFQEFTRRSKASDKDLPRAPILRIFRLSFPTISGQKCCCIHSTAFDDGSSILPPDIPFRYPAYLLDEPDIVMDSSNLFTTHILPSLSPSLHQQHHRDTLASSPDSDDDGSEFGIMSTSNLSYIAQKSLLETAVPLKSAFQLWLTTSCMVPFP
ncbi:hypothetical protein C8J56DRAFT_518084 [Mycena floridula]|nr:hypothetical protein C8J56DRAFT_518084 [Mycena floridula]